MQHDNTQTDKDSRTAPTDLSKFQLRALAVLQGESKYGLAIKRELEDYYGSDINHGRLYPNLDALVEAGFVAKSARDKRTNDYAITEAGQQALGEEIRWQLDQVGMRAVDAEHRLADAEPATQPTESDD